VSETLLEEHETWRLEFSYGSHGPSLGVTYSTPCNSLEECKEHYHYLIDRTGTIPFWANAVHTRERVTEETTTFVIKIIEPPDLAREAMRREEK
jgi:hypothetical protein